MIRSLRKLRRRLLPPLDVRLRRLGGYAASTVLEEGYVGSVEMNVREFEKVLRDLGFRYGYVASLKARECPDGSQTEVGSWVWRKSPAAPCQLHAHLFTTGDDVVDVYCHHEHTWFRHPLKHYRKQGRRAGEGAERLRRLLDEYGVDYFFREREERCRTNTAGATDTVPAPDPI